MTSEATPFFNQQVGIDAYGNGGFRFAEMSHRGSLICLPSGIYGWEPGSSEAFCEADFPFLDNNNEAIEVVLLGTGEQQVFPPAQLRNSFQQAGMALEAMNTGAAVRTYNVLLAEKRAVAAALIAVESAKR